MSKPIGVLELYGKSIAVSKKKDQADELEHLNSTDLKGSRTDPNTLVGVIARSAGVWDNDKAVCSCSGKTVWQERTEQVGKGML